METAIVEIDDVAEPESVWSRLDRQKKADVLQRVHVDDASVAVIRARMEGRRRGMPPQRRTPPQK